jgi:ribosome assembly protein YihI (activator of Der GTPase)
MRIEHLEKRAIEKELAARLSSNEDLSLSNQELTELLRSRIEELNRRLAILNNGRIHCLTGRG